VGLITALPIAATTTLDLPTGDFTRKALLGVVASPAGMLAAVATHLDYLPADDAVRQQQASAILDLVHTWQTAADKPGGTSALVAGDFNTTPGTAPLTTFTSATPPFVDAWDAKMPGVPGYSYPSSAPTERIDFLLVRGPPGGTLDVVAVSHEFMLPYSGTSYVSDHTGFAATLGVP
jgi:endonuclease/exonuclease/phosphatase family metal-dependent hydrolase